MSGPKPAPVYRAIVTKWLGPTATKGTRIVARPGDGGPGVTLSRDYELDDRADHERAARALCAKMDWHGTLVPGGTGDGYVWVFVGSHTCEV